MCKRSSIKILRISWREGLATIQTKAERWCLLRIGHLFQKKVFKEKAFMRQKETNALYVSFAKNFIQFFDRLLIKLLWIFEQAAWGHIFGFAWRLIQGGLIGGHKFFQVVGLFPFETVLPIRCYFDATNNKYFLQGIRFLFD